LAELSSPDFAGRVAFVTGASSGIGKAIAAGLLERGACVWAVGRRRSALEVALGVEGAHLRHVEADLASDAGMSELGRQLDSTEDIDLVVHAAGQIHLGRFADVTLRQFDEQYHVNLRAPFLITQRALPALRRRQGQVVFINSTAGVRAAADAAQYSATKFGLRGLADALRDEVNPSGVRVISVYVGRTATRMQEAVFAHEQRAWDPSKLLQPADVAEAVLRALAMPRSAELYELYLRPMAKLGI
jgi:short-subunit dehydrogenase